MSLSVKKLELFMTEIVFAGSRVGTNGVHPDTKKLMAIVDWCQPPDLLNLSIFLGLTGYFHDLIKGYARITQPFTDLTAMHPYPKALGKLHTEPPLGRLNYTTSAMPLTSLPS